MLIAHLSDLHLRDAGDALWLDRQLDRIAARAPAHLAITGDVLDRWVPALLDRVLDSLDAHGLLSADRVTILHGNHDLASGGGHPRRGADLWRLATRFWDPPPLIRSRRRRFYEQLARRLPDLGMRAPFSKRLSTGLRVAVLDTIPLPWLPVRIAGRSLVVQHAIGCVRGAQATWLERLPPEPTLLLIHHFPLHTPPFVWSPERATRLPFTTVRVPMEIPETDRDRLWAAARTAGTKLLLCGHVHRARLERHGDIAVGLNGQSGAPWAGRTIAWYRLGDEVGMEIERTD